ncbi:hypothetical protein QDY65_04635 [Pyrococcus kukulkanii]|uniref:hypothetical protein n=1 Tax=Pyrococcus kukulkanii TaxID=1609559 RepID=UPI003564A531
MRKALAVILMLTFLPQVLASSFIGWVSLGEGITFGNVTLGFIDVDMGGEVYVQEEFNGSISSYSISLGELYKFTHSNVTVLRVFLGEPPMLYVNATFPPIFVGEKVEVGNLTLKVDDVNVDSFEVLASYNGEEKTFKDTKFDFANYSITITPRPLLFRGEVKIGDNVTYGDLRLEIKGINMTLVDNKTSSVISVEYNGEEYKIEEGETKVVGKFIVKYIGFRCVMVNNMCDPRISIEVYLRALQINVSYDPSREFTVYEGKDHAIGPYMVRVKGIADGVAYISILNSCHDELKDGVVRASSQWISPMTYDGISIGLLNTSEDSGGKKATFITFYNPREKPRYLALLNVTVLPQENFTALVPGVVKIVVKNVGTSPVYNALLTFSPGEGFDVLGDNEAYIDKLDPGKEKIIELRVVPLRNGTISLGKAEVVAPIPYPLACGGLKVIGFTSNEPLVKVSPAGVNFVVTSPSEVLAGMPFDVNFTLKAPTGFRGNLTLKLPEGIGLISQGEVIGGEVKVPVIPGNSTIKLVAVTPGNYTLTGELEAFGEVIYGVKLNITVLKPSNEASVITITETREVTKTISVGNVTKTVVMTQTVTTTTQVTKQVSVTFTTTTTVKEVVTRWSWLTFIIGIAIGAGIIILIAWIQAQRS